LTFDVQVTFEAHSSSMWAAADHLKAKGDQIGDLGVARRRTLLILLQLDPRDH
jgi:hypothetical protein